MKIVKMILFLLPIAVIAQENIAVETWSFPQELKCIMSYFPKGVNTPYISSKGNTLYFESDGELYFINKTDSSWSSPVKILLDDGYYYKYPKITSDNKRLFFSSERNNHAGLYYVDRVDGYNKWSEIKSCGDYINNDSSFVDNYILVNDTTIFAQIGFSMYCSNYKKDLNMWEPFTKSPDFYDNDYRYNSGGIFISYDYAKVYHTSLFMIMDIIDGQVIDFLKYNLAVQYKDFQSRFGQDYLLNINSYIDSIYSKKISLPNYFALNPSFTKNGKELYFAVHCWDTTRIYSSYMLKDEDGNIVGVNNKRINNSTFSLSQNYPNPFNPSTTIKYSIPVETRHGTSLHFTLKVYDVLGREVVTLVNETKQPGNYEVKFNGANLPSGVYFYRLQAGDFNQTKKFVLVK